MKRRNFVTAMTLGTVLVLAIPGTASASTMTSVTVVAPAAHTGSSTAGAEDLRPADCESALVSGGGVLVTGTGGTAGQNSDIHVMGTEPGDGSGNELTGTPGVLTAGNDTPEWLGVSGIGNMGGATYTTQPFAVCFTSMTTTHTEVVMNSVAGPTANPGIASVVATCPSGYRLLGGGARSNITGNKSVKVIGSYPSYSSTGLAAANGNTDPDSWTAVALNGGMSSTGNTTLAYAVCGNSTSPTVTVKHNSAAGPTANNGHQSVTTAACDSGDDLISGGASVSGGDPTTGTFTAPGSPGQGDHLNGSYPSTSGSPTSNGSPTTNWTTEAVAGGNGSPSGTQTDVWGLCIS
jgi:hypothetical protein